MSQSKRLNKEDFARLLVSKGLTDTKIAAINVVDVVLETLQEQVLAGNTATFAGFGKFELFTLENGKKKVKFSQFQELQEAANA